VILKVEGRDHDM